MEHGNFLKFHATTRYACLINSVYYNVITVRLVAELRFRENKCRQKRWSSWIRISSRNTHPWTLHSEVFPVEENAHLFNSQKCNQTGKLKKLKVVHVYVSKPFFPGSSLMKIVYRSNKDFRDGKPVGNDVRILFSISNDVCILFSISNDVLCFWMLIRLWWRERAGCTSLHYPEIWDPMDWLISSSVTVIWGKRR